MYIQILKEVKTGSIRVTKRCQEEMGDYFLVYDIDVAKMRHIDEYYDATQKMHYYRLKEKNNL